MKFSIRTLLAFTFLVALALLTWRTFEDARRDEARAQRLQAEIKLLEARGRLDQPGLDQAILHTRDEFESLKEMREHSLAHFDLLRDKYSGIEPRGAGVLSIRGLPSMQVGDRTAPIVFRMLIPDERPVWLKFGVHMVKPNVTASRGSDAEDDLITKSPFEASGPFEQRLPPGDQMLKIVSGAATDGALPIEITLNDKVLLRTSFVADDVTGSGSGHISVPSQFDVGPRQDLPWLLTVDLTHRTQTSGGDSPDTHAFSVWLSDRSSNFKGFPGE